MVSKKQAAMSYSFTVTYQGETFTVGTARRNLHSWPGILNANLEEVYWIIDSIKRVVGDNEITQLTLSIDDEDIDLHSREEILQHRLIPLAVVTVLVAIYDRIANELNFNKV